MRETKLVAQELTAQVSPDRSKVRVSEVVGLLYGIRVHCYRVALVHGDFSEKGRCPAPGLPGSRAAQIYINLVKPLCRRKLIIPRLG